MPKPRHQRAQVPTQPEMIYPRSGWIDVDDLSFSGWVREQEATMVHQFILAPEFLNPSQVSADGSKIEGSLYA